MNISVIAVGRQKRSPERELWNEYVKRSKWTISLTELEASSREKEGEALLKEVPRGAAVLALDERGKALSSPELAKWLVRCQVEARPVAVLIGGPDGLSDAVRGAASLVLSFGTLTWPHMLARAMLAEQLYRAQTILSGHPYHRA